MGQRANMIVVEDGFYRLYYSHWCANTLPRDLFWGPEHARAFVLKQRQVDEDGWLDEVWAEGGAVLDFDRRELLLYGGEDVNFEVPLRRVYLELLRSVWAGWTVRWAFEGIAEIADHVSYPRSRVLSDARDVERVTSLAPPKEAGGIDVVMSFADEGGTLKLFPLSGDLDVYLVCGESIVGLARRERGLSAYDSAGDAESDFPWGGMHVDAGARTVDFWCASPWEDAPARVGGAWPGWTVRWHHDRFESQVERCRGCLRLPLPARETLETRVREMLLHESKHSPADTVRMLADRDRAAGKKVEVNSYALRDDRLELDPDEKRRILHLAFADVANKSLSWVSKNND